MDRVPIKDSPKLMEAVIQEMQVSLGDAANGLPWLDHVFGRAETTMCDYHGRKDYRVPSVYVGGGKYEQIVPDRRDWGNYAFFYTEGELDVVESIMVRPYFRLSGEVSLVVWGDLRDLESQDDRNVESVRDAVLQALGRIRLTRGHVRWRRVYDEGVDVWRRYSCKEMDGQLMMWPYFGFRFVGEIECDSGCDEG